MKVAILSDIHDHIWQLQAVLKSSEVQACEALICCGDLCAPFVVAMLGNLFPGPIHIVFGNNDADTFRMTSIALTKFPQRLFLHGEYAALSLGEASFAVNHFDNIAKDLAESGKHDWVLFGHNHRASLHVIGRTKLVNPGAIMGMALGPNGPEPVAHSFCVIDTATSDISWHQVMPQSLEVVPWQVSPAQ